VKVILTSGGTYENIDEVRAITNSSTGRIGVSIADALLKYDEIETIYYICGKLSVSPPESSRISEIRITDVDSYQSEIEKLLMQGGISAAILSMAVSDYKVSAVTNLDCAAQSYLQLTNAEPVNLEEAKAALRQALYTTPEIYQGTKISSSEETLILSLSQTPKVITRIRELAPELVLVGFKLLDSVEPAALQSAAKTLMDNNSADFVFANDKAEVTYQNHAGYLMSSDGNWERLEGREAIARAIAQSVVNKAKERE